HSSAQGARVCAVARQNMPNRFKSFEAMPDDDRRKNMRKGFMYAMYRRIQDLKEEEPKLYDLRIPRLRLEDTIYGEVMQLRSPVVSTDATAIKASLKTHVGEWIDLGIAER